MMRFEGGETERGDGERRDSFGWTVLDGLLDFFLVRGGRKVLEMQSSRDGNSRSNRAMEGRFASFKPLRWPSEAVVAESRAHHANRIE